MRESEHIKRAKRAVCQEWELLEMEHGEKLDAMSDDQVEVLLDAHNKFAAERYRRVGRDTFPRGTILRVIAAHSGGH
ncbi:MAG: hypothetical protein ACYTGL_14015 [Planctomycetota bacterium]|jgi:hypothetical protein